MLQQENPEDYVAASGTCHSVREFVQAAFDLVGLDYQKYIVIDDKFYRPAEVQLLQGDSSKAREKLGWQPRIAFNELVKEMVDADLRYYSGLNDLRI